MGVFGLLKFVKTQRTLLNKFYLHDTKLVIDADNLYYFIEMETGIPNKYGGDYHLIADKVKDFFALLKQCGISPYLVFNGGRRSDTKLDINIRKEMKAIHAVQNILGENGQLPPENGQLPPENGQFPPKNRQVPSELGFEMFKHILTELGIPFVVSDFETDKRIVKLANEWKCPVLSGNSVFFLFELEGGFVLLDQLDFPIKTIQNERTSNTITSVYCNFYHFKHFTKTFPELDIKMLPLLDGVWCWSFNDRRKLFADFIYNLKKAPENFGKRIVEREYFSKLLSLLYWLKNQSSVSEAIETVTQSLAEAKRERARTIMENTMKFFSLEFTFCMKTFFETNQLEFSSNATELLKMKGNPLPDWFMKSLMRDDIPKFCIDVLNLQSLFLYSQVENLEWDSSHLCSRHIRQVIYGILILHDVDKLPESEQYIVEYYRNGTDFHKHEVKPIFELYNFGRLPALNDIFTSLESRQQIFLSALGVSISFLETFPTELKLVAATIVYWVKNSSPKIQKLMVSCLVACILYLWAKVFRQNSPQQKATMQKNMINTSGLVKLMLDCEKKDLDLVGKNLNKMCRIPSTDDKKEINIAIIHGFSQFQSCLHYAVYLNSLLLKPFIATSLHLVYCGTFLNNIFHDSHQQTNPQEHIANTFGTDSVLRNLFITMDEAFHSLLEPYYLN